MMGGIPLWAVAGVLLAAVILLRKPLGAVWRLALRSGAGLCGLWLFNQMGGLIGVRLGVNLMSALLLGVLGAPGFGLLLMVRWALG